METLGVRLARARRFRGMTQTDLAVALGDRYSQSMISQVETGRSSFLLDGLVNAALELGVSTDYLLGLTDDPAPASLRVPADTDSESGSVYIEAVDSADTADSVSIPQLPGIPATAQGSVAPSRLESFPLPQAFLKRHQINPRRAGIVEVKEQFMYPALPRGSVVLVDLARRWFMHNLIYLIIINPWTQSETYEVRRLRADDALDFHWNTDFYLDLQSGGRSWSAQSWRSEPWKDEIREYYVDSQNWSRVVPIPDGKEVVVVGQVRGVLYIFDDMGW